MSIVNSHLAWFKLKCPYPPNSHAYKQAYAGLKNATSAQLGLASEGWAETNISGILACNPIDENKKPVIYAFDGEHLLRDNDASAPLKKVASLAPRLDLYFAFIPEFYRLEDYGVAAERYEDYLSRKGEINVEFYKFLKWCKKK